MLKNELSLENIIECLLLVSDEPLSSNQILKILDNSKYNKKKIEDAIDELNDNMNLKLYSLTRLQAVTDFKQRADSKHIFLNLKIRVQINSQKHS